MKIGEIWKCIKPINLAGSFGKFGDKAKIKELSYFNLYNCEDKTHKYVNRVYYDIIDGPNNLWLMDWEFLKYFEKVY